MSAARRPGSALDRALAASGKVLEDQCASPTADSLAKPAVQLTPEEQFEDLILLGSAAVAPSKLEQLIPVDDLIARQRGLGERLDAIQNDSLKTRNLLREAEALVSSAIHADEEEDARTTPRATVAAGGRLAPSRAAGLPLSARGVRATPAWAAATGNSSAPPSARSTGGGVLAGSGSSGGGGSGSGTGSNVDYVEDIRAARLAQCEGFSAALTPLRDGVDNFAAGVGAAAEDNARLAARVESALDFRFSEEELRKEP